jgi:hypothetical protein
VHAGGDVFAGDLVPVIDLALINRLSRARLIRKSFAVKS